MVKRDLTMTQTMMRSLKRSSNRSNPLKNKICQIQVMTQNLQATSIYSHSQDPHLNSHLNLHRIFSTLEGLPLLNPLRPTLSIYSLHQRCLNNLNSLNHNHRLTSCSLHSSNQQDSPRAHLGSLWFSNNQCSTSEINSSKSQTHSIS